MRDLSLVGSERSQQRRPSRGEDVLPGIGTTVANPDTARGDVTCAAIFRSLAAYTSIVIADSERSAALGRKAQGRALSSAGYARMLEEHAGVCQRTAP